MVSDNISPGKLIAKINNIKDDNEIINFIKDEKNKIDQIINILCLCNITNFSNLLSLFNDDDFNNSKYINYLSIINNKCYNQLYDIIFYIKNKNLEIFNKIIYFIDPMMGWILLDIFEQIPYDYLPKFWLLIKDINLMYQDYVSNYTLFCFFQKIYFKYKNENNPNIQYLLNIFSEYIDIVPQILYIPSDRPPFNNLIMDECKLLISNYTKDEFDTVKNIEINSINLKFIKLILEKNKDVIDLYDGYLQNAVIYAISSSHNKLLEFLLENGANINYVTNRDGIYNNVFESALYNDEDTYKIFYNKLDQIDFNYHNTNLNTYAHIVFLKPEKYDDTFKNAILEHSYNLYKPNIEKQNILHLMFSNNFKDDFIKYIDILIKKKLDWNQKDIFNRTPLQIALDNKIHGFNYIINNLLLPNFIYQLNKRITSNKLDSIDRKIIKMFKVNKQIQIIDLTDEIANVIVNGYVNSIIEKNKEINNNIILLEFEDSDHSLFTPSLIDNIIYTYNIVNRYNNVAIPFIKTNFNDLKLDCNKLFNCEKNKECPNNKDMSLCTRIQQKHDTLIKYPTLYFTNMITWTNHLVYNIPINFIDAILNVYNNNNDRYIFLINITIIRQNNNHANILIINLKQNIAIRFEPYGGVDLDEMSKFDEIMKQLLLNKFKNMKYFKPYSYSALVSFQGVSGEANFIYNKLGDPDGFCLAWCLWFFESYLHYESKIKDAKQLKILLNKLFDKIIYNYTTLLDYIRDYGNYLKKNEIKYLKKLGFPSDRLYTTGYTNMEINLILDTINKELIGLVKEI